MDAHEDTMMYPYAEFLLDFDRKHRGLLHDNSPSNTRAAVIVESRPLFFLPMVLRNAMYFLGPSWNLHVLCGEMSEPFVQRALQGWNVHVFKVRGLHRMTSDQYSALLTSRPFWDLMPEERILVLQSDCILSSANVEAFLQYDFVGAPAGRFDEQFIINGGLSLRSRRKMLECIARAPFAGEPEDVFFTRTLRAMGATLPDFATACRFAVESIYTEHPVGVHGTDKCYHSVEVAEKITRAIRY
jgi:hypothetical protein